MRVYQSTAPGYPSRGFRGHVPMAAEPEPAPGPAPEPAPAPAPAPGPGPAPEPAPAPKPEDPAAIFANFKAQSEALATKNAELQALIDSQKAGLGKERANERRQYVRGMGLALPFTDEQLDAQLGAIGDVDARTDAGKAAINTWRAANSTLFRGPAPAPVLDTDKVIEEIVGGAANLDRKIFGARAAMSMITATKKSDFAS